MRFRRHLMLIGAVPLTVVSLAAAFALRFDFTLPESQFLNLAFGLSVFSIAKLPCIYLFERERRLWSYVGLRDIFGVFVVTTSGSLLSYVVTRILVGAPFPRSIYLIDAMLSFILISVLVFSPRLVREVLSWQHASTRNVKCVLIYGAGAAGYILAKEIRSNHKVNLQVVGFLDDDPGKGGASVTGLRVLGNGYAAAQIVHQFSRRSTPIAEIIIAMPSATKRQMRDVIANCRSARIPFRTVPSLSELLKGKLLSGQIRDVSVEDLLGREPVDVSEQAIGSYIRDKIIMVTGGCGSIGSELCRQIAQFSPKRLVIFDQAESDMFMLALELRERYPTLELATEIGDIASYQRVSDSIERHHIHALFHAAAYKHVPLMEAHIVEAARNNVIGSYNVATAAHHHQVERFLMISSDKAVNPTSIMGVTKRVGELIVASMQTSNSHTCGTYLSVRFGNVLASNGSVVQVFRRQIAAGGPVTITHPEMRRYFMSISEAVQLVLQAYAMGKGGEIFVLDMGQPVHITELAENMIRLAGLTPGEDISIQYTGLRPGEKLFEEINTSSENMLPTHHDKIKIFHSPDTGPKDLSSWISDLEMLLIRADSAKVKEHLLGLVPEYIGQSRPLPPGNSTLRRAEGVCA